MMKLTRLLSFLLLFLFLFIVSVSDTFSQNPDSNETTVGYWPESCTEVAITSTMDGKKQRALFMRSTGTQTRPLIISLHTWSGNFEIGYTLKKVTFSVGGSHFENPFYQSSNVFFSVKGMF